MARPIVWEGISVAEPPPPPSATKFFKRSTIRPRPLQERILEYLSQGGEPSINAIASHLKVWRFSVQRSLKTMKREGSVEDNWIMFAPTVVPKLKAHVFSITERGRKQLPSLQSTATTVEAHPLGYRVLLYISHGHPMTTGQIAKICAKDKGHVKRVMTSLTDRGLVRHLFHSTRTRSSNDVVINLWQITGLGREALDAGPEGYLRILKRRDLRATSYQSRKVTM